MTSALAPLALTSAAAGPNGATVVGGSATVQGQGTANVVVNQTSNSAIINWNTFNISAGQTTRINMPSANSTELDRVTGGLGPSQILGSLSSNGQVFLVNPDGILFGAGSRINVGGLLATTNNISNADFMAGRYNFSIPGMPNASIVNQGSITAQTGGFAALVAPGVRNTGTITAKLGTIALASGNAFTLDLYGDNLLTLGLNDSIASRVIDVSTGKPLSSLVSNAGTLKANGGKVELTAVAARKVVDSVINNTGNIEANTIGTHNGMIVLGAATSANKPVGAPTQTVKVSGTLSAAGKGKGTTGGTIEITGENVQLSGAAINASGAAGGGAVLIGGDWGGGSPNKSLISNPSAYLQPFAVPTASTVSVDTATTINASATTAGNGGKVIVWSDDATTFYGTILAQGGPQSGQGGFVETSGHQLTFNGAVNTSAPNGAKGTLLLDPLNATIAATAGSEVITTSSIESALATGDVIVTTVGTTGSEAGDIIVASGLSWANASTLTLNAYHDIDINSGVTISNTGAGNLVLRADATGLGIGTVNFNGTGKVDFSSSTGTVSIFYNPTDNPTGSIVYATSYVTPFDYIPYVLTNGAVPNQLTAYMLVNTVYDLQNIQNNLTGDYALGGNIIATQTASWNGGAGFIPVGQPLPLPMGQFAFRSFTGIFDGEGYAIDGLTISATVSQSIGLFGDVGNFGTQGLVENVGLTNETVSSSGTGSSVGGLAGSLYSATIINSYVTGSITAGNNSFVGGAVGSASGTISNSHSTANVIGGSGSAVGGLVGAFNGGSIIQSYATGNVADGAIGGGGIGVGGLVGQADFGSPTSSEILRSFATGTVTTSGARAGGLIGNAGSTGVTISESYATGPVIGSNFAEVGGLIGDNAAIVNQTYAIGAVSGQLTLPPTTGGLIGFNGGPVTASYWNIQTTGQPMSPAGTGVTTTQLTGGLPSGFDPTVWGTNPNINNGYPYLLWTRASAPSNPVTTFMPTASSSTEGVSSSTVPYEFGFGQVNNSFVQQVTTTVANSTAPVINNLNNGVPVQAANGSASSGSIQLSNVQFTNPPENIQVLGSITTTTTGIVLSGTTIQFQIQKEAPNGSGNLSLDCLATVLAMIGSIIDTQSTGVPTTYFARTYSDLNSDYGATRYPSKGETPNAGAPVINIESTAGLTTGALENAPLGLPNPAVFSQNPSLQNIKSFPAIIGGTISGSTNTSTTYPHFMLAVGIDQKTGNVIAIDPLTGTQVEINPLSNTVVGATGQLATFQAVGFVGVSM
jgi:filamentous hemagglutinin family protein